MNDLGDLLTQKEEEEVKDERLSGLLKPREAVSEILVRDSKKPSSA